MWSFCSNLTAPTILIFRQQEVSSPLTSVSMTRILLQKSEDLLPQVEGILSRLFARLTTLAPDAELHHIGATAVPGTLTKGDLDVMLGVPAARFTAVTVVLKQNFVIKQRENWTPDFASFGDDSGFELPVGIQLIAKDSATDFLLYLRDYLIARPEAVREYNALKVRHAPGGSESYWKAKDEFFAKILAARRR